MNQRQANHLVDAADLAGMLSIDREWVYSHADQLGAIRLGNGPRPRLRFEAGRAVELFRQLSAERHVVPIRGSPRAPAGGGFPPGQRRPFRERRGPRHRTTGDRSMQAHRESARVRCSGNVVERPSRGGEIVYSLRLRIDGRRPRVTLGTAREGWTREAAEEKLRDTLGALRSGVALDVLFPPDEPEPSTAADEPTLGEVMDCYLADRRGAVSARTLDADKWAIEHLRAFFGDRRPSDVTPQLVDLFRRQKVAEADGLRQRIAEGDRPLEERSYRRRSDGVVVHRKQPRKPLGPRFINTLVDTLATLLDVAMERSDVELTVNAARGRRRKLKVVQPKLRSFLEVDQVWALLDAAAIRERRITTYRPEVYPGR
jgi:hypothetical protein